MILCLLLLHLVHRANRVAQVDVAVEACILQFDQFVLRLTHPMRNTLSTFQIRRTVRHDDVFSRDIDRRLTVKARVKVDLLEGVTCQSKAEQHPLVLRAVLLHDLGQLIVHVISDTNGRVLLLRGLLTDDLGLDRPCRREGLHDGLGLELNRRLHQQRVEHPARTRPRFCPVLVSQTKDLQSLDVGVEPVFTRGEILLILTDQLARERSKFAFTHEVSKVSVKVLGTWLVSNHLDHHAINPDSHAFGVFNHNFNRLRRSKCFKTLRSLHQTFIDGHLDSPNSIQHRDDS